MPQRFVCCFLLAVILALPMGWAHAEEVVVNRVVAIVDDEVVTSLDLDTGPSAA